MRWLLAGVALASVIGQGSGAPGALPYASKPAGRVLNPDQGDRLFFCDAPGLKVRIKIDSATTGAKQFAMGTAELSGSNIGTHDAEDEIIFIYEGRGRVLVGDDWFQAEPGTTMYVPHGVKHGFTSDGGSLRFVWVIAPQGLEQRFREGSVPSLKQCAATSKGQH